MVKSSFFLDLGSKQLMLSAKCLRSEPFLWIHLSGIVMFPVCLGIMWVTLAMGNSFSTALELLLLAGIGIVPVFLMQLTRPFNIFSILFVSLKPECLSESQREILALFKTRGQSFLSLVAAGIMTLSLWFIYHSPVTVGIADLLPQWHIFGFAIAILAFLAGNLFLQVPLSALLVLLTKQEKLAEVQAYSTEEIEEKFTSPGIKVNKIMWFLEPAIKTDNKV